MKTKAIIKGWTLFCVLMLLGFSTGCTRNIKPGKPVWAVTHQHMQYTPDKYVIGVGLAKTPRAAEQKAKDQITDTLKKRLSSELMVRGSKLTIASTPALDASCATELLSVLPRVQQVLSWSDAQKTRYYSMVVMDRTELTKSTLAQVKEWDAQSMELVVKASAGASLSPYSSLINLMAAISLRVQAEQLRALLAVLDSTPPPAQKGPSLHELVSRVEDLLGRVHLTAAHGKNLYLNANAQDTTLVLSADLKIEQTSIPFSGCPVVFEAKGIKPISTRVGPAGMATVKLNDLSAHAGQKIIINCHIQADAVLQDSGVDMDDTRFAGLKKILETKSAYFKLRISKPGARKIAIALAETRGGELRQNSRVVELLQHELISKGYNVLAFDELGVQLPKNPSPESMSDAFQGKADLLIYGVAATSLIRKVSPGLSFAKATAQIVLLKVATGKVIIQQTLSTKSPGLDMANASDRAFRSLARKIFAALEEQGGLAQ